MSAQHRQTPGDHTVLNERAARRLENHRQSVGCSLACDDGAVRRGTTACLPTVLCEQTQVFWTGCWTGCYMLHAICYIRFASVFNVSMLPSYILQNGSGGNSNSYHLVCRYSVARTWMSKSDSQTCIRWCSLSSLLSQEPPCSSRSVHFGTCSP